MHGDGGNLWLQVSETGARSWLFRYAIGGRERAMGLGALNAVNLAQAREKAASARNLLADGKTLLRPGPLYEPPAGLT
jgi:hypothetical protein